MYIFEFEREIHVDITKMTSESIWEAVGRGVLLPPELISTCWRSFLAHKRCISQMDTHLDVARRIYFYILSIKSNVTAVTKLPTKERKEQIFNRNCAHCRHVSKYALSTIALNFLADL